MTKNQQTFLSILHNYAGIADNGNIMAETVWPRSKVIAVGRSLMKLNVVNYTPTQANGFEGGVWRQNESFKGRTEGQSRTPEVLLSNEEDKSTSNAPSSSRKRRKTRGT
jgi:hypothetical protein